MKKWKRLLCVALATTTAFSMCACGGKKDDASSKTEDSGEAKAALDLEGMSYDEQSKAVYDYVLSDFYEAYSEAKEITDNLSERYAKMAIAEAKLMESGIMCPTTGQGGAYRLTRVAPYSNAADIAWGLDARRYDSLLVTTDFIKAEDYEQLRSDWKEMKGTGKFREHEIKFLKDKGYTLKDTYTYVYSSEPTTWDILSSSKTVDSEPVVMGLDPLLGYNVESELTPKLAESYEISEDGLTYTFHIRKGAKWVDSQEREIADVTADDFVAGMQHMCDAQGGLEFLVDGVIKNATQYISGDITDFGEVGIKAVDDYTLEYSLEKPCPYFLSMLGYSVFFPMNRSFYESKGGKFGAEYDNSADDYKYGKTPDDIAYCGAYVVKSYTAKNSIVYKMNETYWNKKNTPIKHFTYLYTDGADEQKTYADAIKGITDSVGLSQSLVTTAKKDGNFDKYATVSSLDGTTYSAFYNLNRTAFANANDESQVVSAKSDEEKERTKKALLNQNFRLALNYAFDRGAYNAQRVGEDLKFARLKNLYTGWNLVFLPEDITIAINGTDTTFKAGTSYAEVVQAQVDADGYPFKVYDPEADNGNGSGNGYDGWFNKDEAVKSLDKAITELADQGVTIDEEHPIIIEMATNSSTEQFLNQANAYKQSIESNLDKKVIVQINEVADFDTWGYCGYYCSYGYEMNYDMYDFTGWGPDYGDPSTFLDTLLPDYAGYSAKNLGIF